ncbi:hypothetical protein IGI04_027205 [Brassica rapa subsp. trilocularis]|uniref:Uncharacterized protein n=1 Tax=Brassica rapa subsp. trilocularis TaxID=1813537 RepID=A0ABQ7L207_BRACM|nr:hypothetical protein IGI04_027205 [Brassica rapa subsp. trilocularis]
MQPTVVATGKNPPRVGYENSERKEWQSSVLQDRNTVENCVQMGLRAPNYTTR